MRQALLTTVLTYHVVPGSALRASAITSDQRVKTLEGANLTLRLVNGTAGVGPTVRVIGVSSSATVVTADVPACKSVVHIVDTVLLPTPLA